MTYILITHTYTHLYRGENQGSQNSVVIQLGDDSGWRRNPTRGFSAPTHGERDAGPTAVDISLL